MPKCLPVLAAALLIVVPTFAQEAGKKPAKSFEEAKQQRLLRIDQMRACVAKASNFEQMKACKPERKNKDAS